MPGHTAAHEAASNSSSTKGSTGHTGHPSEGVGGNNNQSSGNDNYQDRIQRISSGVEPGHRPTDARPHGLAPEEANRQGLITKDQMNQAMNNPGIDTSGNYQEKIGFWEQVSNVASNLMENSLTGKVLKLGGDVLSKLGEYSSDLQKKAMTYSLNQKVKAKMKTLDLNNPNTMHDPVIADLHKDLADIQKGEFTQSDFNKKYGSPEIHTGGGDGQDRELMNIVAPVAPYEVSGTTPIESQAAKWYSNLGGNSGGFNLGQAYAAAQAKQKSILGSPSAIGLLAVNQSPFYDFLKLNKIDRGIL